MGIYLRPTTLADLDFVLATEQAEQDSGYIGQWTHHEHMMALQSADIAHLIITRTADDQSVGYAILQGLTSPHGTIDLKRIVVAAKGNGYGRRALQLIKHRVFETYGADRLWLDVKSYNPRAQQLYQSEGFVVEGILRDCVQLDQRHRLFREQGQPRASLVIMSILRPEYDAFVAQSNG
ncbi:MAG: GNAT family protein [Leptolyngbyaceae bacterium]|nr:GNAT family protein [Leptolyngbyaceae bacterium]